MSSIKESQKRFAAITLHRIAEALDTTAEYLFDGATGEMAIYRSENMELLAQFQAIEKWPDEKKDHVKILIASVVKNHNLE